MTTLFRRLRRPLAGSAAAAALTLGLVAAALVVTSPAGAQGGDPSCADSVTGAPTGPATVSAASTSYGRVLVVGSGDYKNCSLYVLTSDPRNAQSSATFACSDSAVTELQEGTNPPPTCFKNLWPALLTDGAPIAGPGVKPKLLGTVERTVSFASGSQTVEQVTYAGQPLYRFFQDENPGETDGANLLDNVVNPTGIWYLVEPVGGRIAPGRAQLELGTGPVTNGTYNGTAAATVLAASMNDGFRVFPDKPFPVYTFSGDSGHKSACTGECAVNWPPVLTSGQPEAIGYAIDQHALGTIVRPDGTHQVTYNGKPLYMYVGDAYIGPLPPPFNSPAGTTDKPGSINGDGRGPAGGDTFHAIFLPPPTS